MKYQKIGILILLSTLSTVCFSQTDKLSIEPYEFENRSGEKVMAELGKFSVPENRSKANSRNIELGFVRFKSTNPNPGNPIVYLAGGPGGSGVGTAKGPRFELFMKLREVADVIAFDQRGTGFSNHIPSCASNASFPLNEPGTSEKYLSGMSTAAKECLSFWKDQGVDIAAYNTMESANDLEDLRKVLGVPKINIWGISYGSHLAFDFIKRYESSVDRVVLAGLEGPDHTIKLPEYNQNFLKYLNSKIQEDNETSKVYPSLITLMTEVLTTLDKNPVTVETKNPRTGESMTVGLSKLDVQLVTSFFLTKNPQNSSRLPLVFHQMKNGNYQEVAQMVAMIKMYAGQMNGMSLAMDAMSGVSKKRWGKIKAQESRALLGRTTNFPFPDLSQNLGLVDLGDSFRENPISRVPALFFSGTLDGRTYLESSKELVSGFKNGSHIIIDGAGHDSFMSTPKVGKAMLEFFQGNKVASQTWKIEIPKFALPE